MGREVRDGQADVRGGLNVAAAEDELAENQLRRADNAHLSEFGGATKRRGTQRTHAAAIGSGNPVRGGFSWQRAGSTQQLAVANGLLHTGTYGIPMTWSAQVGALDAAAYPRFAHFRDGSAEVAYIADGGLLNKWDGAALSVNIAGTPSLAFAWVYNARLYGVTGQDQTIYYSTQNNGDTIGNVGAGGGAQIVRSFGAQSLIGGFALGQSNVLVHREGLSRWTGWTQDDITIDARAISSDVGSIAPGSLIQVENTGFLLSDRGFYAVTEAGVQPISGPIEPVISALDHSKFNRVCAAHDRARREVLWYLPDVGVYAFNYRLGAWSGPFTGLFTDKVIHALWTALDATGNPIVLVGGPDGFVRRHEPAAIGRDDVLSDGTSGSAFALSLKYRRLYFPASGGPSAVKAMRRLFVTGNPRGSTGATVGVMTATGSDSKALGDVGSTAWGTGTWGSGSWGATAITEPVQLGGRGPYADVTITDDGLTESLWTRVEVQGHLLGARTE